MENIKIRTAERYLHRKLKYIAVYINGKHRFRLTIRKGINKDGQHDIAAIEAARVTAKQWGLLTETSKGLGYKEWELLKFQ
jgi:hypothetical protein